MKKGSKRKYGTDKFEATRLLCSEQDSESETFLIWQSGNLYLRSATSWVKTVNKVALVSQLWNTETQQEIQKYSDKYRNTVSFDCQLGRIICTMSLGLKNWGSWICLSLIGLDCSPHHDLWCMAFFASIKCPLAKCVWWENRFGLKKLGPLGMSPSAKNIWGFWGLGCLPGHDLRRYAGSFLLQFTARLLDVS